MSRENVETVKQAIAAVNERDIDRYLACCTEDIELRTPLAGGVYNSSDDVRRFFADIQDATPDFHLDVECVRAVGADQVLAYLRPTASGRASGMSGEARTANVYDFFDGKIRRVRIFLDRAEALRAVGLSEQDDES